ncbi:MAG TPA: hypothetical protein VGI81_19815 [Tepidisphaeraceae bacterium]|jgi:Cu/Ag efflux protein CusF
MKHLILSLALASAFASVSGVIGCQSAPEPKSETSTKAAFDRGVPGGTFTRTQTATGNVTAVDAKRRLVTLDLPEGVKETVQCGPEVANFDQIRVGDQLRVTVTDEVKVFMATTNTPTESGVATIARAPIGAKPSAVVSGSWQTTATVTAIDVPNRRATLQFEDGSSANVRVRDDVDMNQRQVGDKVVIRINETIAIAVGKA